MVNMGAERTGLGDPGGQRVRCHLAGLSPFYDTQQGPSDGKQPAALGQAPKAKNCAPRLQCLKNTETFLEM